MLRLWHSLLHKEYVGKRSWDAQEVPKRSWDAQEVRSKDKLQGIVPGLFGRGCLWSKVITVPLVSRIIFYTPYDFPSPFDLPGSSEVSERPEKDPVIKCQG